MFLCAREGGSYVQPSSARPASDGRCARARACLQAQGGAGGSNGQMFRAKRHGSDSIGTDPSCSAWIRVIRHGYESVGTEPIHQLICSNANFSGSNSNVATIIDRSNPSRRIGFRGTDPSRRSIGGSNPLQGCTRSAPPSGGLGHGSSVGPERE
jgi:hypothetical protein